ncbi:YrzE family protein [Bradyrhizobium brasilense]|uniref:YrzE family protein n=1 Tax=Bradyrhizobium brasilense TaxID=1419277 RepID=A0ABY8JDJ3_9BRAD|nr:YrzE family protein [Bradyrhizobium brasilense]WFU62681.1 YrzE family protein [Bradyrhizobium brasilense]
MNSTTKRPSAIARLRALLGQAPHDYRPATQVFLDLDVQSNAREMALTDRGSERGTENRPQSSAETLDDVEHQVVERIESHKQDAHGLYLEHLHTYDQRVAALNFEERFTVIQQAAPEAVGDFAAEASLGRDELFALRRRLHESEAEREGFRVKHGITRPARLVSLGSGLLKAGVLAVLFIIETAINGSFLAKASEQGYLGGIVQAIVFAAFNILVSFLWGLVPLRLINRRSTIVKFAGILSFAIYLLFAFALNLTLAHLREVPPTLGIEPGQEVLKHVLTAPFDLTDVMSWLLFGVGFMFSLIAMVDGLTFFDPHVGYAGLERRWNDASLNFTNTKAELIERLRSIRDDASEAMNDAARDLTVRRSELDALLQARSRLAQRFVEHQAQIERACNALLQTYREANRRARSTDAPSYFDRPYKLDRIVPAPVEPDADHKEDLRRSIVQAQETLRAQTQAINDAFDSEVRSYKEIDQFFPEAASGKAST